MITTIVPADIVEEAAKRLYYFDCAEQQFPAFTEWEDLGEMTQENYRQDVRLVLEVLEGRGY